MSGFEYGCWNETVNAGLALSEKQNKITNSFNLTEHNPGLYSYSLLEGLQDELFAVQEGENHKVKIGLTM